MGCDVDRTAEGEILFVCSRGRGRSSKPCSVPGCSARSSKLCDFPLAGRRRGATCDRPLCEAHATKVGSRGTDTVDYCPAHAKQRTIEGGP